MPYFYGEDEDPRFGDDRRVIKRPTPKAKPKPKPGTPTVPVVPPIAPPIGLGQMPPAFIPTQGGSLHNLLSSGFNASRAALPGILGQQAIPGMYGNAPFYGNIPMGMDPRHMAAVIQAQMLRSLRQPATPWLPTPMNLDPVPSNGNGGGGNGNDQRLRD